MLTQKSCAYLAQKRSEYLAEQSISVYILRSWLWENPQQISFYNLQGKSFANSFQLEINYSIAEGFNTRFAYKNYNIETDYTSGRLSKPITPNHRFFASTSYETEKGLDDQQWKFDLTYNYIGEQRLPNTASNPTQYQLAKYSNGYHLLNFQVTKVFSKKFEMTLRSRPSMSRARGCERCRLCPTSMKTSSPS